MKAVLPVAGKGTRLRPHTHIRSKSLVKVAGEEVLSHIIKRILKTGLDEIIFITDEHGEQIADFMKGAFPEIKTEYVLQEERKGPAHAIYMARDFFDENDDILVVFNDSICETDFSIIKNSTHDGIIWVKEVKDPKRFGVVMLDENNNIKKMVEKPDSPISNLAMVGMYYFKHSNVLFEAIEEMIKNNIMVKGEYYLPAAFEILMNKGRNLTVGKVDAWLDCGKPETLLETNRYLLSHKQIEKKKYDKAVIIEPVYIGKNVKLDKCCIGPYVSIGDNCVISNSVIENSIIGNDVDIKNIVLNESLIANESILEDKMHSVNIGDNTQIFL